MKARSAERSTSKTALARGSETCDTGLVRMASPATANFIEPSPIQSPTIEKLLHEYAPSSPHPFSFCLDARRRTEPDARDPLPRRKRSDAHAPLTHGSPSPAAARAVLDKPASRAPTTGWRGRIVELPPCL